MADRVRVRIEIGPVGGPVAEWGEGYADVEDLLLHTAIEKAIKYAKEALLFPRQHGWEPAPSPKETSDGS